MPDDFQSVFAALKAIFADVAQELEVTADQPAEYTLVARVPSPMKQHKGQPMWFGSVRLGKAYVSFHLMPLYMNETLTAQLSPALKKRMQGKTCFNFKIVPDDMLLTELRRVAAAGFANFRERGWA
jgi:hypothetical protein